MAKKNRPQATETVYSRKKEKVFDVDMNIKVAYKTGNLIYGKKKILKEIRQNLFKMIIISKNCPKDLEDELNYYNKLSKDKVFIHKYYGSSWDLGLALAKPYMISSIGIIDPGDSDILSLKTKSN